MGNAVYEDEAARDLGVTRWAGYGVPALCDEPDCAAEIDRGLGYRCGDARDGFGCGLSFCSEHLWYSPRDGEPQMCQRCCDSEEPVEPKPDTAEWEQHMLTDESWAQWRDEHPAATAAMRARADGGQR